MDVRIYTFGFKPVAVIGKITSVNWVLHYNDIGTFEMHMPARGAQARAILENDYLVAEQDGRAAIITTKQIVGEDLMVCGRTMNWILSRKIVPVLGEDKEIAVPGGIFGELVCPYANGHGTFLYNISQGLPADAPVVLSRTSPVLLSDAVRDYLAERKMGHEVLFTHIGASGRWQFRIFEGRELNLVLSEAARTASDVEYTDDVLSSYTHGYYAEAQEADADGNPQESVWTWVGDDAAVGNRRWETLLSCENAAEAGVLLAKAQRIRAVTGKMRRLRFGADYGLGDVLRVQMERGDFRRESRYRVTGVHIWEESANSGEQPILEEET